MNYNDIKIYDENVDESMLMEENFSLVADSAFRPVVAFRSVRIKSDSGYNVYEEYTLIDSKLYHDYLNEVCKEVAGEGIVAIEELTSKALSLAYHNNGEDYGKIDAKKVLESDIVDMEEFYKKERICSLEGGSQKRVRLNPYWRKVGYVKLVSKSLGQMKI